MELSKIKKQTTWNDAASSINSNTQKIGQEIDKLKLATYKNKGYFATAESLVNAYPTASAGSIAYVGSSYPYAIYTWNGVTWVDSGETGGDETVDLGGYYTKEETHEAIKDEYEVIPQEVYDALENKKEKLYFCYEE
jgi:hypothetical protein